MRTLAAIFAVAALWCGCSSGPSWKRQMFAFARPVDPPPASAGPTNTIALEHVSVSPLFQNRSFTYRVGDDAYEQDPYAGFLIAPDRALSERLRAGLGAFGRVVEPGSALRPGLIAEVSVSELYGDFRKAAQPESVLTLHFVVYQAGEDGPGQIIFDKIYSHQSPLSSKRPAALMAAWEADLDAIFQEVNADYAKGKTGDSTR